MDVESKALPNFMCCPSKNCLSILLTEIFCVSINIQGCNEVNSPSTYLMFQDLIVLIKLIRTKYSPKIFEKIPKRTFLSIFYPS